MRCCCDASRERDLPHLATRLAQPRSLRAFDQLIGDLRAERVAPERLAHALRDVQRDGWDARRNADTVALYGAYLEALRALPPCRGLPRADGRDALACTAELIAGEPERVRARLRRPFARAETPARMCIVGLMDLRRGWRLLLEALCATDLLDELHVYLPSRASADAEDAACEREMREFLEPLAVSTGEIAGSARAAGLDELHNVLFRTSTARVTDRAVLRAIAAPDEEREAAEIARRVKRLIVRDACAPEQIAVVARESRPYAPLLASALRAAGVPVSARLRYAASEAPAVAALLGVLRAAAQGWSLRELRRVGQSPYFHLDLDLAALAWIGARAPLDDLGAWQQALERLAARAERDDDVDDTDRRSPPPPARATQALASFRAFHATAKRFAAPRPLSAWIALTREMFGEEDGPWPAGLWALRRNAEHAEAALDDALTVDAVRLDCRALDAAAALLAGWAAALALDPAADPVLDCAGWHRELVAALDAEDVVLTATHQRGVQVIEAFAAVGRPCEHLFLVGMSSGAFPADPAPRPIFSDAERARLREAGLPLEIDEVWYAREAALFRALVGTARRTLTLSHAYAGADGGARLPSPYFEEVREQVGAEREADEDWVETIPGSSVAPRTLDEVSCTVDLARFAVLAWRSHAQRDEARAALAHLRANLTFTHRIEHLLHVAHVEEQRTLARAAPDRRGAVHPWNGRVEDDTLRAELEGRFGDAVWSVSRLEKYGNCPWSFFAGHVLGLAGTPGPEDDIDAATRGSLLHLCLERLHRQLAAEFGDEALSSAALPRAEALLPELVRDAADEMARQGWLGSDALRATREQEILGTLLRYVRWEAAQNEKEHHTRPLRRAPREFEFVFGMEGHPPVELERGGRTLKLRGKIDRIDEITDERARGWLYVADHKSSGSSVNPAAKYEEGAILQLPLYLHVVQQHRRDAPGVWGGAYQTVGKPGRAAALHLFSYTKARGLSNAGNDQQIAASRFDAALDHALDHVERIREGIFPARVAGCCKSCPSYCDFKDICREDKREEHHA